MPRSLLTKQIPSLSNCNLINSYRFLHVFSFIPSEINSLKDDIPCSSSSIFHIHSIITIDSIIPIQIIRGTLSLSLSWFSTSPEQNVQSLFKLYWLDSFTTLLSPSRSYVETSNVIFSSFSDSWREQFPFPLLYTIHFLVGCVLLQLFTQYMYHWIVISANSIHLIFVVNVFMHFKLLFPLVWLPKRELLCFIQLSQSNKKKRSFPQTKSSSSSYFTFSVLSTLSRSLQIPIQFGTGNYRINCPTSPNLLLLLLVIK